VILALLLISAAAAFATQLMVRANATVRPEGTAATVQRIMLYIIPLGELASGLLFNFPLRVLLYWFASNLWTLAQQAYIIRFHPPPDEPGEPAGEEHAPSPAGGDTSFAPSRQPHAPQVGARPVGQSQRRRRQRRKHR
jgi:YidC/Oxa1 family membrane protein insertase